MDNAKPIPKTVTVADTIAHLMTFPPNMEVWHVWDESGEYFPATAPQARTDYIKQVERRGKKRWRECEEHEAQKAVCVLSEEYRI